VFFIPALTGLGSPYWRPEARGLIGGLTRATNKAHIARACLEGISLSVAEAFSALAKDSGSKIRIIRVDGGASKNDLMMQYQSDVLSVVLQRPVDVETTVRGAAYIAAYGAGLCKIEDLAGHGVVEKTFSPNLRRAEANQLIKVWKRRVKALLAGAF